MKGPSFNLVNAFPFARCCTIINLLHASMIVMIYLVESKVLVY